MRHQVIAKTLFWNVEEPSHVIDRRVLSYACRKVVTQLLPGVSSWALARLNMDELLLEMPGWLS